MADEPVNGEPVWRRKFPAIREKNREFYENRAVWQKAARQNVAKSVSCRTIPYNMKQGINSRRTASGPALPPVSLSVSAGAKTRTVARFLESIA
jgi:hypothetical protein